MHERTKQKASNRQHTTYKNFNRLPHPCWLLHLICLGFNIFQANEHRFG